MQEMTGCSRASSASRETKTTAVHNQMHYQRWFIRPPCITCLDYHHCALKRSKAISQFFSPSALRDFFGSSSFSMYDAEGDAPLGLWHTRNFFFNLDLFLCNWKSCKFPSVTRCLLCVQKEKDSENCIISLNRTKKDQNSFTTAVVVITPKKISCALVSLLIAFFCHCTDL